MPAGLQQHSLDSFDLVQCSVYCRMNKDVNDGYGFGGPGVDAIMFWWMVRIKSDL